MNVPVLSLYCFKRRVQNFRRGVQYRANFNSALHYIPQLSGKHSISDDASTRHFKPVKRGKIMHEKHCRIDDVSENSE
jgi:hypothetical protein